MRRLIGGRRYYAARLLGMLLVLAMVWTVFAVPCAAFSVKQDNLVFRTETTLAEGLTYQSFRAEQTGRSQECYLYTYKGGLSVLPVVYAGAGIYGRETTSSMAQSLSMRQDGDSAHRVLGGMNGDFFSMATGIPLGVMIDGGEILSSDAGENALGITGDGKTLIGKPSIAITLHKETTDSAANKTVSRDIKIDHINKYPSIWGAYLCTPDFGKTTHSTQAGLELVFRLDEGSFAVGKTVRATLMEIRTDAVNGAIPEDGFVIVIHNSAARFGEFSGFSENEAVSLTFSCANGWENVTFAVGGGDVLVENGKAYTTGFDTAHGSTANPRTAIGYTADGKILVFAVDGKSGASKGMTLAELAATMRDFGCIGALNLDGGGSTTVLVCAQDGSIYSANTPVYTIVNTPADGAERKISNAILFVSEAESDGIPCYAEITPGSPVVYRQTPTAFSVLCYDKSGMPVDADAYRPEIVWSCTGGTITPFGVFTPDAAAAEPITVSAEIRIPYADSGAGAPESGTPDPGQPKTDASETSPSQDKLLLAKTNVYCVDTLDGIYVEASGRKLEVPIGGTSDHIRVFGIWKNRTASIDPSYLRAAFVTPNGAVINEQDPAHCAYGSVDAALAVHNTMNPKNPEMIYALAKNGFPTESLVLSLKDRLKTHSVCVSVTFGAAAQIVMDMNTGAPRTLFHLDSMDPISRVSGGRNDSTAIACVTRAIAPAATPAAQHPVKRIDLYIHGKLPGDAYAQISYQGNTYTLPWTLADDFTRLSASEWKRISLDTTAIDPRGIRDFVIDSLIASASRFSLTIDDLTYDFGDTLPVFTDISDSWAQDAILTIRRMGVIGGIPAGDGTYRFNPSGLLTRAEFAKMICTFEGLSISDAEISEGALPFSDFAEIPAWALPYIKAVTDAQLMRGKSTGDTDSDGNPVYRFAAGDTMTRAEVLQVLGSLLTPDDPSEVQSDSTTFADDGLIPDWAKTNVIRCVDAGIITGFQDNTIRPMNAITRAETAVLLVRLHEQLS